MLFATPDSLHDCSTDRSRCGVSRPLISWAAVAPPEICSNGVQSLEVATERRSEIGGVLNSQWYGQAPETLGRRSTGSASGSSDTSRRSARCLVMSSSRPLSWNRRSSSSGKQGKRSRNSFTILRCALSLRSSIVFLTSAQQLHIKRKP